MLDDPALASSYPELAAAQVLFDAPTEHFKPAQTTVDLYLYDVRENMELRSNEPIIERRNGEAMIRRAPMRVACSYLVTAWPVGGEELALQEHRLLSQVVQLLASHPTVPASYLRGTLAGQEPPLPLLTTHADGLKNPSEFWTALGNKLRPSLNLVATISMQPFVPAAATLVTSAELILGVRTAPEATAVADATRHDSFRIAGRITDHAGAPIDGANVQISNLKLNATTDDEGRYVLQIPHRGVFSLRVMSGALAHSVEIHVPRVREDEYDVKLTR